MKTNTPIHRLAVGAAAFVLLVPGPGHLPQPADPGRIGGQGRPGAAGPGGQQPAEWRLRGAGTWSLTRHLRRRPGDQRHPDLPGRRQTRFAGGLPSTTANGPSPCRPRTGPTADDGDHELIVQAVDGSGKSLERRLLLHFDNLPPVVLVKVPTGYASGQYNGDFSIKGEAADEFSVARVELEVWNNAGTSRLLGPAVAAGTSSWSYLLRQHGPAALWQLPSHQESPLSTARATRIAYLYHDDDVVCGQRRRHRDRGAGVQPGPGRSPWRD